MTSTQAFKRCIACLSSLLFFMTTSLVQAAPGAHGPNGEHLDTVQQSAGGQASAPRLDAKSELFELVATLSDDKLSILIDRFDTNEPVLRASVEIESGSLKAPATFHEDLGDYRVEDAQLLKQLREPGEHPLVFTVSAGADSDFARWRFARQPRGRRQSDRSPWSHAWRAFVAALDLCGAGVHRGRDTAVLARSGTAQSHV